MVRADRVRTPCSAWRATGANLSFTCDDSDFPPEAFPYLIDPSGSFYPATGDDDGWAEVGAYAMFSCPAWTGGLAVDYVYGSATAVNTVRSLSSYSNPLCMTPERFEGGAAFRDCRNLCGKCRWELVEKDDAPALQDR